ncbi:MAG: adenylate/guanylate cyclase domain-containing protein [Oceanococcaceae bacterium]
MTNINTDSTISNTDTGAVLFADVVGSTRLYERYGDAVAKAAIDACLALCSDVVTETQGRVVKTIGDEIMCVFPDACSAARAAIGMQQGVEAGVPGASVELAIRVGFHAGEMIVADDGDVFGDAVNVAARMAAQAKAAQIVTTETTITTCSPELVALGRKFDTAPIKGKSEEMGLFDLLWQTRDTSSGGDNLTQMLTTSRAAVGSVSLLMRLQYQDRKLTLDSTRMPMVIGRESRCDFLVASPYASRQHATLVYRRGKFIFVDQSTNGSYVSLIEKDGTQRETLVKREDFTLIGRGVICLGEPLAKGEPHAIHFEVD